LNAIWIISSKKLIGYEYYNITYPQPFSREKPLKQREISGLISTGLVTMTMAGNFSSAILLSTA
jgi:hypothetical protein